MPWRSEGRKVSGSTSRELKDALDIQGGGLEQHWVFGSRVSWIWKPDHSCVTRAEREYSNRVEIEEKGVCDTGGNKWRCRG